MKKTIFILALLLSASTYVSAQSSGYSFYKANFSAEDNSGKQYFITVLGPVLTESQYSSSREREMLKLFESRLKRKYVSVSSYDGKATIIRYEGNSNKPFSTRDEAWTYRRELYRENNTGRESAVLGNRITVAEVMDY